MHRVCVCVCVCYGVSLACCVLCFASCWVLGVALRAACGMLHVACFGVLCLVWRCALCAVLCDVCWRCALVLSACKFHPLGHSGTAPTVLREGSVEFLCLLNP